MSGGKGGSTTSEVSIPEYIEAAAQRNLNKAERISQIGYTPYYGPDVAAFTPMQQAGFQNTADLAGAYGMAAPSSQQDIMGGMGPATQYAGGVQGYSSAPMYEQSLAELGARRPGQKAYIDSFFIDPYSGGTTAGNFAPIDYTRYGTMAGAERQDRQNELNIAAGVGQSTSPGGQGLYSDPNYTTYGGHRDVAHANIDKAFIDYGKSIKAGTARPEDNPAYNAGVAAANQNTPITFISATGQEVTKPAFQITSSDFEGVSQADAGRMAAATMLSAGISNIGGGFNQNDPTTGFMGGIKDAFGNIVENTASFPIPTPTSLLAGLIDKPNSTYDATGQSAYYAPGGNSDQNRALAALTTAPSFSIGGNTAAETAAIKSNISDDDFWAMAESDPTVGAAVTGGGGGGGGGGADTGGGDGSVLCTAYASMGYLPADIWSLDTRYGIKRFRQHPVMVNGYRLWAAPIARFIKTEGLAAKAVRAALWPIVWAWAEEMAHVMKPKKYSGNKFGKVIMAMGEPFSYAVGATFLKRNAQKEL